MIQIQTLFWLILIRLIHINERKIDRLMDLTKSEKYGTGKANEKRLPEKLRWKSTNYILGFFELLLLTS